MSWKTDKFQPLRDQAIATGRAAEAVARTRAVEDVTRALCPPAPGPESFHDLLDKLMFESLSSRRASGKTYTAAAISTKAQEHQSAWQRMLRQAIEDAKQQAEVDAVTRELRGENDNQFDVYRPAAYKPFSLNVIKPDAAVIPVSGI